MLCRASRKIVAPSAVDRFLRKMRCPQCRRAVPLDMNGKGPRLAAHSSDGAKR